MSEFLKKHTSFTDLAKVIDPEANGQKLAKGLSVTGKKEDGRLFLTVEVPQGKGYSLMTAVSAEQKQLERSEK